MKDRIKEYLISGLKPADICSIVGCSPGYISQLWKDPSFKSAVEEGMLNNAPPAETVLDHKYESLEHTLVTRMKEEAVGADLGTLSRALDSVTRSREARTKARIPALAAGNTTNVQVVTISIPAHALAAPKMNLNNKNEVIEIDGRPMAPLSAEGVRNLFNQIQQSKEVSMEGVQNDSRAIQNNAAPAASDY